MLNGSYDLEQALANAQHMDQQMGNGRLPEGRSSQKRRPEDLTPREREILQLVWSGMTNRIIADRLHISIKTAEAHRANMMKKLRVSNTAQLIKAALEGGLLVSVAG